MLSQCCLLPRCGRRYSSRSYEQLGNWMVWFWLSHMALHMLNISCLLNWINVDHTLSSYVWMVGKQFSKFVLSSFTNEHLWENIFHNYNEEKEGKSFSLKERKSIFLQNYHFSYILVLCAPILPQPQSYWTTTPCNFYHKITFHNLKLFIVKKNWK